LINPLRNAGFAVCAPSSGWPLAACPIFFQLTTSRWLCAEHSNRNLGNLYIFSSLWSGQPGSLPVLELLLSITSSPLFSLSRQHPELMPYVGVVLAPPCSCISVSAQYFVRQSFTVLALPGAG